jgi:hypothetical protein
MRNFDYPMPQQGRMVKQQLARMMMDARALYDTLQDDDRVPAWTLLKINTAEDRLHVAADYLRYKARPGPNAYGAPEEKSSVGTGLKVVGALAAGIFILDLLSASSAATERR